MNTMNQEIETNREFYDSNERDEKIVPGLHEAKIIGKSLGQDIQTVAHKFTHRASLEVESKMTELRLKIFAGLSATLAATYAVFWVFAAIAFWLYPAVPFTYSVSGIALFHLLLAGFLFYKAKQPIEVEKAVQEAIAKSSRDIKTVFADMSVKADEIKNIANEALNPMTKVKRNPEAFVVGSFCLGVALSIFMPSSRNGAEMKH